MRGKCIDYTGHTFNKLTALRFSYTHKHAYWVFRCDCGRECIKQASAVTSGRVYSCGCSRRNAKRSGRPRADYTGQVFGTLTITRPDAIDSHKWFVLCRLCGKETSMRIDRVVRGTVCDCQKTPKHKTTHYIDNSELERLIADATHDPQSHTALWLRCQTLAYNIATIASKWRKDIDDYTSEGTLVAIEKTPLFTPTRGKAFNFLTTVILNHYRRLSNMSNSEIDHVKKHAMQLGYLQLGSR